MYKCLYSRLPLLIVSKLKSISQIRNKIAHNIWLERNEIEILYNLHKEISYYKGELNSADI